MPVPVDQSLLMSCIQLHDSYHKLQGPGKIVTVNSIHPLINAQLRQTSRLFKENCEEICISWGSRAVAIGFIKEGYVWEDMAVAQTVRAASDCHGQSDLNLYQLRQARCVGDHQRFGSFFNTVPAIRSNQVKLKKTWRPSTRNCPLSVDKRSRGGGSVVLQVRPALVDRYCVWTGGLRKPIKTELYQDLNLRQTEFDLFVWNGDLGLQGALLREAWSEEWVHARIRSTSRVE
ncbi:hypothetical protein RRG08_024805 [Elysia crispata]|uniref:Uncharacterized protein n=1 Tax=Elysia crispata TaxID=231223 RepID=A0AAE0YIX6_9GAST|nr:hypothetical protein RRG08_024805 [Elysia crispata]